MSSSLRGARRTLVVLTRSDCNWRWHRKTNFMSSQRTEKLILSVSKQRQHHDSMLLTWLAAAASPTSSWSSQHQQLTKQDNAAKTSLTRCMMSGVADRKLGQVSTGEVCFHSTEHNTPFFSCGWTTLVLADKLRLQDGTDSQVPTLKNFFCFKLTLLAFEMLQTFETLK